jgi:long-chain acyl-CoA synthetase
MFSDAATRDPNGIALDDLSRRRTWAELRDRSTRIARFLRERIGLGADDHVAILMGNRVEFVELTLGAFLAGVWVTPINRHLQADEIGYVIDDSGARVLFTDPAHDAAARDHRAQVVVAGEDLDQLLHDASDEPMPLDGPAGGTMFYTSGTTGRPKGVKRARVPQLGAALDAMGTSGMTLGLDGSGPHLITGPLYHAAPLLFAMYDQANGAPLVIMPRWDDELALDLLQDRAIPHTHLVPTMFVRLLRSREARPRAFDPSALRLVLHGAAPIAPTVKRRMIEWWGPVLVEYWGATESGVCTLVDAVDWLAHAGTVGRPIATFEVFAVDDSGMRLPPGDVGSLYCRHRHRTDVFEYHGAPEKTAAAYLEPGVFTLGDVGYVDADGYVYLSDRRSNMIVSGGVNIYPAEVEQVLQQHPAVADVAVFGVPDEEWGESVKAAVELMDGVAASGELEADIIAFGRRHLAAYKAPRSIDFEARLPRHPTGKLHVRMLREPYWKERARQI